MRLSSWVMVAAALLVSNSSAALLPAAQHLQRANEHALRPAIPLMREAPLTAAARSVNTVIVQGLPLWTLGAAGVGVLCPAACASLGTTAAFGRGLALLMLSSGLQLTPRDLTLALRSPRALLLNAACCFAVAPACALGLGWLLGAEAELRDGLVLLGCVSGGQASNLFASLAGGDLALSVVLTVSPTRLGTLGPGQGPRARA